MMENEINRRQFIETSGHLLLTGVGITFLSAVIASCGEDKNPVTPDGADRQLNVNLSDHAALQQVGGFKTLQLGSTPAILFRMSETEFKTLSRVCTHQGCTVDWQSSNNKFDCPCHGSQFDRDGKVTQGPAGRNLSTFRTEFNGNQVVIYY